MKYRYSYKIFIESEDKEFMEEKTVRRADTGFHSLPEVRAILSGAVKSITSDAAEDESERLKTGAVSK